MNAGIQGLAADIFKVALVEPRPPPSRRGGSASRLILQVHDEVLLEVRPPSTTRWSSSFTGLLAEAGALRVPLEVNLAFGDNWAEAK